MRLAKLSGQERVGHYSMGVSRRDTRFSVPPCGLPDIERVLAVAPLRNTAEATHVARRAPTGRPPL